MTAVTQKNNLAYDYRRLARQEETAKQPQIHEVRAKKHAVKAGGLSVARVVVLMLTIVLMLSGLLYTRVVQIEVAKEYNQTSSTLSVLKGENSTLLKQLEDKLSIANVEEIARDTLGMQKSNSHLIHYITFETKDSAEVVQKPGLLERIVSFFAGLFS